MHTHTRTQKNMQSHTVAQWGEGFNKPTVTWIYGGVSGLSQETRWTYLPPGTERNSEGGGGWEWGEGGSEATGTLCLSLPLLFLSPAISLFTRPLRLCSHHQPHKSHAHKHWCVCQRKCPITLITFHAISASTEDLQFVPQSAKYRL